VAVRLAEGGRFVRVYRKDLELGVADEALQQVRIAKRWFEDHILPPSEPRRSSP